MIFAQGAGSDGANAIEVFEGRCKTDFDEASSGQDRQQQTKGS
jgi:hypothetical protein